MASSQKVSSKSKHKKTEEEHNADQSPASMSTSLNDLPDAANKEETTKTNDTSKKKKEKENSKKPPPVKRAPEPKPFDGKPFSDEQYDSFIQEASSDEGWVLKNKDKKCKVFFKKALPLNIFKVRGTLEAPASVVYDFLMDPHFRLVWDPFQVESFAVETIGYSFEVNYYCCKFGFGLTDRDFVNASGWRESQMEDGRTQYVIMNSSILHDKVPAKSHLVRGTTFRTGYVVRQLKKDRNRTLFTYYTHSDPNGYVPKFVMNAVAGRLAPNVLETIRESLQYYSNWKSMNSPNHKPWMNMIDPNAKIKMVTMKEVKKKYGKNGTQKKSGKENQSNEKEIESSSNAEKETENESSSNVGEVERKEKEKEKEKENEADSQREVIAEKLNETNESKDETRKSDKKSRHKHRNKENKPTKAEQSEVKEPVHESELEN